MAISECSVDGFFARTLRKSIPFNALFELTYRCNLRCRHCYVIQRGENELRFSEVTRVLDQLAAANCLFLTLSGGEVMVRKDFLDIARYAHRKGFALRIFTNGNLIDARMAGELASLQPVEVGISVYGSRPETHDYFTGVEGSLARSLNALKLLKAGGVMTVMKCLLMRENLAQIGEIRALAQELGAALQYDPTVTPKTNGDRGPLQHQLTDEELSQLFGQQPEGEAKDTQASLSGETVICRAGWDMCSISPDGEVHPCLALPLPLGNLREASLAEIWQGPASAALRRLRAADLHECVSCADLPYCTRCWGLAATESGDYLGPSHLNCRIARIRHRISVERGASQSRR